MAYWNEYGPRVMKLEFPQFQKLSYNELRHFFKFSELEVKKSGDLLDFSNGAIIFEGIYTSFKKRQNQLEFKRLVTAEYKGGTMTILDKAGGDVNEKISGPQFENP